MLLDGHSLLVTSHLREKIYKGINIIFGITNGNNYINDIKIDKININFIFKNTYINKVVFYSFLLLMEKLTLSKFQFLRMKNTIADFNIKKGLISGASYLLRGYKKDRFIYMLANYSLKKTNQNIILSTDELLGRKKLYDIIGTERINFGLKKFLFHGIFSSNDTDYDFFYPLINKYINGMNIHLYFNLRNFLVNRLLMSHHSISIY